MGKEPILAIMEEPIYLTSLPGRLFSSSTSTFPRLLFLETVASLYLILPSLLYPANVSTMPRTSLLSYLTQPNPVVDTSAFRSGGNSKIVMPLHFISTSPWKEFNYGSIYAKLRHVLESEHALSSMGEISAQGRRVFDEDTLEHQVLSRDTIPMVNEALESVTRLLEDQYGKRFPVWQVRRGGVCVYDNDSQIRADWALVSEDFQDKQGYFYNFMPGDSKISSKWKSTTGMRERRKTDMEELNELPIQQVATYCDRSLSRYGFVISDAELVVFELRKDPIGPGIAATRPQRTPAVQRQRGPPEQHQRVVSMESIGSSMAVLSITGVSTGTGLSAASYQPNAIDDPVHMRYKVIPWDANGKGKLTVRLALFCLALIAAYGNGLMGEEFSDLDSFSFGQYHETAKKDSRQNPPPTATQDSSGQCNIASSDDSEYASSSSNSDSDEDDPSRVGKDGATDTHNPFHLHQGNLFVKRSAVRLSDDYKPHYFDQHGDRHPIDEDQALYDSDANDFVFYCDRRWLTPLEKSRRDHALQSSGKPDDSSTGSRRRGQDSDGGAGRSGSKRQKGSR